jgi:hypothetical protein
MDTDPFFVLMERMHSILNINHLKTNFMKTIKLMLAAIVMVILQTAKAQNALGEIKGIIKDEDLNPVMGAVVKITQGGILLGGATTDENGKYSYKPLNAGEYEVVVTSLEYATHRVSRIEVQTNEATYVDVKLKMNTLAIVTVEDTYEKPLVDNTIMDIKSVNAEEFRTMSIDRGNFMQAAQAMSSQVVEDGGGGFHFRGSRVDATEYLIDGIKVNQMNGVPAMAVENLSIITGGIPAMYGDLTSGVMVITTKDYFSGMRAKRIRESEMDEKQEFKRKQRREREDETKRKEEIEKEKSGTN